MANQAKPFLKWAGGKGQLLEQFKSFFPKELNGTRVIKNYYEPFLGSGAVFFWIMQNYKIEKAYINELNPEIYACYIAIQKDVENVINYLKAYQKKYRKLDTEKQKTFYYNTRDKYNKSKSFINYRKYQEREYSERAAMTIFLNKTCFNGLYRVNAKGEFNVPFGKYINPTICDENNLRAVSKILKGVKITNEDFSVVRKYIKRNSFVYFDPPYRPLSKTSNFTSYSSNAFDDHEQKRLAILAQKLHKINGVRIMLSNSDPKNVDPKDNFFDKLYSEFKLTRLKAKRLINSNAKKRGEIKEILVTNY